MIVLDLLDKSEMYLLPGLKKHCGNFLARLISLDNVVDILKISRLHNLIKLEDSCTEFIADNISGVSSILCMASKHLKKTFTL